MRLTIEVDNNILINGNTDKSIITIERDAVTLDSVLEIFEDALLGIGYRFRGNLEFVDNDDE